MVLLILHLFLYLQSWFASPAEKIPVVEPVVTKEVLSEAESVYQQLEGCLNKEAFLAAWEGSRARGYSGYLAIADFTQSSDKQRFYIIDLQQKTLVLQTWVAHGKNSGEKYAEHFSNENASHMSSPGLYQIGDEFISPKHGPALLLEGLEKGVNDNARAREIIIHGADYVSENFIETHGRCGRSFGCPALPRDEMATVIRLLSPGSLLYIYTAS